MPDNTIIDLGGGGSAARDLHNMLAALSRRHGAATALALFAEGFAQVFAAANLAGASPIAGRYALEATLDNAQAIAARAMRGLA